MTQRFGYEGFTRDGARKRGEIDASTDADARRALASRGIMASKIEHNGGQRRRSRLWVSAQVAPAKLFSELAILTSAGLTLDQSIKAILAASSETGTGVLLGAIVERLAAGTDAAKAFALVDDLPSDCLALIASGERSGRITEVLSTVAADLEARERQRKELIDAMIYPAFLLLMMAGALGMITFVLVPALMPVFESADREPPLLISLLDRFRQLLSNPLLLTTILAFASILALYRNARRADAMAHAELLILSLPLIGTVKRQAALSRYLLSLSLLLQNSVPVTDALALSADCCPVKRFHRDLLTVKERVSTGARIQSALAETKLFPPGVLALASVGEEVNRLPVTLMNAGTVMREDAKRSAERLLALLTPIITIVLGALVGALVISVMTALLSINELST